jgi:RNA polymerase sigma-70 factor (ECF subfamily)
LKDKGAFYEEGSPVVESEELLVERAKVDPEAFGMLYQQYVDRIYNYIYYRVSNHHDAEDLTARTFQQALTHIGRYVNRGVPFSAWLYRIAHNIVANWYRSRSRRRFISLDDLIMLSSREKTAPDSIAERNEERAVLLQAIRRLPEDRQQLLILKFTDRYSNREIGRIMGRTEGAIKSLYHRTLLALRDELQGEGLASFNLLNSSDGRESGSHPVLLRRRSEGD